MTRFIMVASILWTTATFAASGPVAVLPFRNLSGDSQLDWLRLGIAETLVADLQKDGSRKVVERTEIDRALAELALQSQHGSDDGMAAQAGKLVGAQTVVVGGFQTSGGGKDAQLRVTARFVDVESGVVHDSAKIDGKLSDVFAVQDQIVARLLKKSVRQKPRPKPAAPEKRAEAFRVYSLSLSTSSQADQVKYLKQALDLDPDFHYAQDDLAALEYRLKQHKKQAAMMHDEKAQRMFAIVDDQSLPEAERVQAINEVLSGYMSTQRHYALRDTCTALLERRSLPKSPYLDTRELCSYYLMLAAVMLKDTDLALQLGERHLQTFPAGPYASSVRMQMESLINASRLKSDAMKGIDKELADIDKEEQKLLQSNDQRPVPNLAERRRIFAFRRCTIPYQGKDYRTAITQCLGFAERSPDPPGDTQHLARMARYFAGMSYSELGKFDEARVIMQQLNDEDGAWARSMAIPTFLSMWPSR